MGRATCAENTRSENKTAGIAMVAATGLAIGLTAHAQGQQQILVIEGGTLINGNGGAPAPNSVIVKSLVA
jgi:hypothetical protein